MAELTDRRQRIANAQSSLSLSSLTESTERQNRWCKNYNPRFRPSSTGNSDDQWFGLSKIKRTQMLLWFVIVITFFRLGTLLPNVEQADAVDSVQKNITETKHDSSSSSSNGGKSVPTTSDLDKPTLADDRISDPAPPQTGMIVVKDKDEPPIIDDSNDDDTKSEKQNKESRKKKSKNDKAAKPKLTSPPSPTLAESDAGAGAENKESNPIPAEGYVEDKKGKNSQSSAQDPNNKDDDANSAVPKTTETTKDALLEKLEANDEDEDDGVASPSEATIPQTTKQGVADTDSSSSNLHNPRSDSDLSETASKFVETHCDLNNVQDGQWYPLGEENEWKQRAPYVIVAGVWNAGVNPLANALLKHPRINTAKQNGFFLPKQFKKYIDVVQPSSSTASDDVAAAAATATATTKSSKFNVKVFAARERMYAQVYSKSSFQQQKAADTGDQESLSSAYNNSSSSNNNRVAMDVSPGLIFYAHQTAHSILCTAPWVKVVVVLRNPIDRLYQQWVYSTTHLGLKLSLEDWMAPEMKLLQTVGLISGTGTGGSGVVGKTAEANGVEAKATLSEKDAWNQYQSVHKMAGAIGRSLYVFQLEQWIKAYIAAGKNPYEEIIILTTEEIEDDPVHQYGQLIQFLGLPPLDPKTDANDSVPTALQKSLLQRNNSPLPPMEEETRKMLRRFFKPYNKRLAELLQSNGFEGEWDKRWKN